MATTNELTTITHTGDTGHDGFTITTGYGVTLAEDATRDEALTALFHRGLRPLNAAHAVNAAVRIGHFAVLGLPAN